MPIVIQLRSSSVLVSTTATAAAAAVAHSAPAKLTSAILEPGPSPSSPEPCASSSSTAIQLSPAGTTSARVIQHIGSTARSAREFAGPGSSPGPRSIKLRQHDHHHVGEENHHV